MKKILILLLLFAAVSRGQAQKDSSAMSGIFEKITKEAGNYKIDTSAVPDDRITRKIIELRALRGGFNINEAVAYKIGEQESKKEVPAGMLSYLKEQFSSGKGKRWLDNAVIHIYRSRFTYKELKQMVKFYKTSAGQKFAADFPLMMVETLGAAQIIQEALTAEMKNKN